MVLEFGPQASDNSNLVEILMGHCFVSQMLLDRIKFLTLSFNSLQFLRYLLRICRNWRQFIYFHGVCWGNSSWLFRSMNLLNFVLFGIYRHWWQARAFISSPATSESRLLQFLDLRTIRFGPLNRMGSHGMVSPSRCWWNAYESHTASLSARLPLNRLTKTCQPILLITCMTRTWTRMWWCQWKGLRWWWKIQIASRNKRWCTRSWRTTSRFQWSRF
jgi:hypothetical protein